MESGKIIVVANQKGGVAKTSTVRNLSYALAEMGKKVLVVDFDPQYNLTTSFGVLPTQTPCNTGTLITNLLLDESLPDTNEFIQKIGSVDLIPSSRSLTVAEANLLMTPDSNDYLAALLNPLRLSYDYIIVDTNPSLGSLTINALTAADEVIIPIDPELFALTGLQALVDTIKKIKRKLNPSIEIGGILFTKCNKRTNLYRRTYGQVTKAFQSLPIFNCQIPYTVKVGDANSYGMSVMELEQANPASLAYVFVCDPYRRYATIRSLSAKKCMRTFRLGAEYDKEALQDRLLENQRDIRVTRRYFEFMRPYTREYARKNPPTEKYYRQRDFYLHLPRVTGYLSFFRCVAIVLGVAPLYEKEYRQPLSAECREACRRLDRFTAEITLVCREHLDTPEDVQRFLARMDREMDAISAARSKIRNKQRGCADPVERGELKKSCAACTAELSRLRKQKQTAYNMIEDNPKLKDLLACEWDVWVENDPYLSPREKQVLRNQQPSQEDKTIIR